MVLSDYYCYYEVSDYPINRNAAAGWMISSPAAKDRFWCTKIDLSPVKRLIKTDWLGWASL